MRRPLAWLLLSVVAVAPRLAMLADEPQQPPLPQFTTKVQGAVPDLAGRWFVVAYVSVGGQGDAVPFSLAWEVTSADGKPNLAVRWGGLPSAIQESYTAAASQRTPWEPTEQQLRELRDSWDTLTFERPPVDSVETTISGPDDPGPLAKAEPTMKDALFVVEKTITFTPRAQSPTKDVMVFGAREALADGYRGDYAGVTIANAPFPVHVPFKGTFRAYRLGPAPQPSLWQRLLGIFKGCGREQSS
jgi:hypothetical protein